MTPQEAIDTLLDGHCPMDGTVIGILVEVTERMNTGAECRAFERHYWPYVYDAGDYLPDPELVEEKLEEYARG